MSACRLGFSQERHGKGLLGQPGLLVQVDGATRIAFLRKRHNLLLALHTGRTHLGGIRGCCCGSRVALRIEVSVIYWTVLAPDIVNPGRCCAPCDRRTGCRPRRPTRAAAAASHGRRWRRPGRRRGPGLRGSGQAAARRVGARRAQDPEALQGQRLAGAGGTGDQIVAISECRQQRTIQRPRGAPPVAGRTISRGSRAMASPVWLTEV